MGVNDYQIGGKHYQLAYQHWDFVIDTNLHYLYGCATKYIARWRQKNGVEDLRKAIHYLSKAQDTHIPVTPYKKTMEQTVRFTSSLPSDERWIIADIMQNNITTAILRIERLIKHEESIESEAAEPDSRYTNQD